MTLHTVTMMRESGNGFSCSLCYVHVVRLLRNQGKYDDALLR